MNAPNFVRNVLPPIVPFVVVTVATEFAVRQGWVPSFLVPAPSSVVLSMFRDWPELWRATLNTANASLIGFGMSVIIGSLVAIALSSAAWVQRAFYPYAVFFQTVPIIAIAPLLVIWFGWDRTVVASAFIVSIFPVIANTLTGLLSTDPALRDLFPEVARGALENLLERCRSVYRRRSRWLVHTLRWTRPGTVWATDFTTPPALIDGVYPRLLLVRDLASGRQLLGLPCPGESAGLVVAALRFLF